MQSSIVAARRLALGLAVLGLSASLLSGCGAKRPPPLPAARAHLLPWGALPLDHRDAGAAAGLRASLVESIRSRLAELAAASPSGRIPYRVLSISGGGSRGAFGAGVLSGWSARGDRPEFDVVTGISTGALMATTAFLGPDQDADLALYTRIADEDVFRERGLLSIFRDDALYDTEPLRELIAGLVDEETLELVAREHARGRRLFVGTTNLDAQAFVVWDMGAIAASGREDRLQRYRDVVLASASYPMAFPPVYIPVRSGGRTWYQMHVDGGVRETVFFYDFVDEYVEALERAGVSESRVDSELYLLNNGALHVEREIPPVGASTVSVGLASFASLMRKATLSSLYRLWVLALSEGADFHISFVPPEVELSPNPLAFDPEEMRRLFELGDRRARRGEAWSMQAAPTSRQELVELIHPEHSIDTLEARPWLDEDPD